MNILLADDIQGWLDFNQQNIRMLLGNDNVNFYAFNSAKEAYDFSFTFPEKIDLVVTDLEMEHMYDEPAGAWLIKNLKTIKATQTSRYIIISSSYNIDFIAQETKADGYLRKPSYHNNPETLKYLLEEVLGVKL